MEESRVDSDPTSLAGLSHERPSDQEIKLTTSPCTRRRILLWEVRPVSVGKLTSHSMKRI
jgi:hypothetical protein